MTDQTPQKTALLIGATGLTGRHCLDFLVGSSAYQQVRTITRRPLTVNADHHLNRIANFDQLLEHKDFLKADDIFCCLGTTMKQAGSKEAFRQVDFTYASRMAEITAMNGANQFLITTSIGANAHSLFFYNRVKGEIEDALIRQNWPSLQIFRPSVLLGNRPEQRRLEKMAVSTMKSASLLLRGPLEKYRAIDAQHVASVMVAVAEKRFKGINIYESDEIAWLAGQLSDQKPIGTE